MNHAHVLHFHPSAVLITEFLLVDKSTTQVAEDGTLFTQEQLGQPTNDFVQEQLDHIGRISKEICSLLQSALEATEFDACPSPRQWSIALRRAIRRSEKPTTSYVRPSKWTCSECETVFFSRNPNLEAIRQGGKPVLCGPCFQIQYRQWSETLNARDQQFPQILCDHCRDAFRIPRAKLSHLKSCSKPLLCRDCLDRQMQIWKSEQLNRQEKFASVSCNRCATVFPIRRTKLIHLESRGQGPLCRDCLKEVLNSCCVC